ncbi:hypothetical protein BDZ45DRAFT_713164 [Acephala macrosclerotiorum]|nr:hypothetical protein BDZ45DRAFT_713164 [Acephala macrosclerotiorum]
MPESINPFIPKQALAQSPALYDGLIADCMENLAAVTLSETLTIPSRSVLHDNGCGAGAGTVAIVSSLSDPTAKITIKGTDINEAALEIYRQKAIEKEWPAEALNMDSAAVKFPDETFRHSLSNALLFVLPNDGISAVKEVHRTLKPDGVTLFNTWSLVPNMHPIQTASALTRPPGTPLPCQGLENWTQSSFLLSILQAGGFKYAIILWSLIGGMGVSGWLESDEERWDEAVDVVVRELRGGDGFAEVKGGSGVRLRFVANVAVARK